MSGEKLTGQLWRRLTQQLTRKIGDRERAEDCLQSAYVKMAEYSAKNTVGNEEAFLRKVAVNLSIDDRRSAHVRHNGSACISELIEIRDATPLPDEVMMVQQRLESVRAQLMRLTPRTREVFLMHRLDGLKHREIAQKLGISVSAVEKQIAKAVLAIAHWNQP